MGNLHTRDVTFKRFDEDFDKASRRFNFMFKAVSIFIGVVFCLVVAGWIFIGTAVYKGSEQIKEQGASGMLESFWCGKKTDCRLPGIFDADRSNR